MISWRPGKIEKSVMSQADCVGNSRSEVIRYFLRFDPITSLRLNIFTHPDNRSRSTPLAGCRCT